MRKCKHCGKPIKLYYPSAGQQWMHVAGASIYAQCGPPVAEPEDELVKIDPNQQVGLGGGENLA